MAVDPRNFLLNTDYEMDKIVLFKSGSINAGNTKTIAHNLPFTPLVFGVCAFNSDFSDSRALPYAYETKIIAYTPGQPPLEQSTILFSMTADSTNINLSYTNRGATTPTFYYRIYGFEPSNSTATVPANSSDANKFILNTDYNYCKLHSKGTVTGNGNTTINHNLGYKPLVLAWKDSSLSKLAPITTSSVDDSSGVYARTGITLTNTSVIFNYSNNWVPNSTIHYRIYYDEI